MDLTANGQVLTGPWTLEVITGSITDETLKEYSKLADGEQSGASASAPPAFPARGLATPAPASSLVTQPGVHFLSVSIFLSVTVGQNPINRTLKWSQLIERFHEWS
jgi:hypothetical protein